MKGKTDTHLASAAIGLVTGQIWKVGDKHLRIGRVGPRLVHHRFVDGTGKLRGRETFSSLAELQELLRRNKAVLEEG